MRTRAAVTLDPKVADELRKFVEKKYGMVRGVMKAEATVAILKHIRDGGAHG